MADPAFESAKRALERMKQQDDAKKGYYGTVKGPVEPATADNVANTLTAPDPADPSYIDHTQPTMADKAREILGPSYEGAQNLVGKVRDKAADLDWRNVAKRGLEIAAGPLGALHYAQDKMNSLANRDGGAGKPPPAPPEQPADGGQPQGGQQPAWGTPVQPQAQQNFVERGEEDPYTYRLPQSDAEQMRGRGGKGGKGRSEEELARMAAGNVGITEPYANAINQAKGTIRGGVQAISGRQDEMQHALQDEVEARRQVAFAEEAKARAVQDAVNERMGDEQKLRSMLADASNISPERYWDSQGGSGAKFAAAAGLLVSGFAGPQAVESTMSNINKQIDRHVESQVASYNAKLGMAKEVRAQWDARMQALGDIHSAKISAKMQGVEAAKSYFLGQMNLAKTDEAKTNLAMAADHLDLEAGKLQQDLAQHTAQKMYERIQQQQAQGRADALRAATWAREDRHREEDKRFRDRELDKNLDSREDIAKMRGAAGAGGRGQAIDLRALAKQRAEIDPMIDDADRLQKELSKGDPNKTLEGYGPVDRRLADIPYIGPSIVGKEGVHNRQVVGMYTDMVNKAITGASSTDKEQLRRIGTLIGSGKRGEVVQGIQEFNRFMTGKRASVNAGYSPEMVQEYERRRAAYREEP